MNISSIDLNLLGTLTVVLEEGNVTKAAHRLNLTQAAVSNALARARDLMKDPLLIREGRGMVPTPIAQELLPHLRRLIAEAKGVMEKAIPSDPRKIERCFTIACADNQLVCDVPAVTKLLAQRMPRCSLRVVSVDFLLSNNGLAEGNVDASIGPPGSLPGMHSHPLYEEIGVVAVRKNHPSIKKRLTKAAFNSAEHVDVLVTMGQGGRIHSIFERLLLSHGLHRTVRVSLPSFAAAAFLVGSTDCVACLPNRLATALSKTQPIRLLPLPMPCPAFASALIWHERTSHDSASQHFRQVLIDALSDCG